MTNSFHSLEGTSPAARPDGSFSRRRALQAGGTVLLSLPFAGVLASCSKDNSGGAGGDKEVIYAGYGGTYEQKIVQAQLDPFQKDSGITVKVTTGADQISKIRTMVKADRTQYDVVDTTGPTYGQLLADDLLSKMDTGVVKTDGLAEPKLADEFSVPQFSYAHCVFWNSDHLDGTMTSWKDVWDFKRFPGKRGFQKLPYYLLEEALMADGVEPSAIYPLDIPRALKMLDQIRPHAVFQDLNTIQNLVAQGEVVTGDLNLARVQQLVKDGSPLKYSWNQNLVDYVRWVVPKGAPHEAAAWKLIAATLTPERQLAVLKSLGYTPTLKAALDKITQKERSDLAGTPETLKKALVLDANYYAEHGAEAQRAVQNWLIKG